VEAAARLPEYRGRVRTSTRRPDERGLALAREVNAQIDLWLAEFIAIMDAREESGDRDGAFLIISQNTAEFPG